MAGRASVVYITCYGSQLDSDRVSDPGALVTIGARNEYFNAIISSVMSTWCPSCCAGCFVAEIPSEPSDESPYSLENLLPVGSVLIKLGIEQQHLICDHNHAQDGWHYFNAHSVIPHLSDSDDISFCRQIEFLVKHRFIMATYRATYDAAMALRVYLIPYDLSNVQGKLRVRGESVLAPAKRYLRQLLPKIINNEEIWNGLEPTGEITSLIPNPKASYTHIAFVVTNLKVTLGWPHPCTHLQ